MLSEKQIEDARVRAHRYLADAGIVVTAEEAARIEVADFGLGELATTGLQLLVYINTARVCAKELVLFPRQTCPEHRHPPIGVEAGKEETFRVRSGTVYLYVEGDASNRRQANPPAGRESGYTVFHEVALTAGQQHTIEPDTLHWFQAGAEGAVVTEFSTHSRDGADIFTDTDIVRQTVAAE